MPKHLRSGLTIGNILGAETIRGAQGDMIFNQCGLSFFGGSLQRSSGMGRPIPYEYILLFTFAFACAIVSPEIATLRSLRCTFFPIFTICSRAVYYQLIFTAHYKHSKSGRAGGDAAEHFADCLRRSAMPAPLTLKNLFPHFLFLTTMPQF